MEVPQDECRCFPFRRMNEHQKNHEKPTLLLIRDKPVHHWHDALYPSEWRKPYLLVNPAGILIIP